MALSLHISCYLATNLIRAVYALFFFIYTYFAFVVSICGFVAATKLLFSYNVAFMLLSCFKEALFFHYFIKTFALETFSV